MEPNKSVKVFGIVRSLSPLIEKIRTLVRSARRIVATNVNTLQVCTNFEIGRLIVEHEQEGQNRAVYGKATLVHLSVKLASEFGRGFSEVNLSNMRKFYILWRGRLLIEAPILQKASEKSPAISDMLSRKLAAVSNPTF